MDSNTNQVVEISLKDLFFVLLKNIWLILIVGIVLAGGIFGYKKIASANASNVLDISKRLDSETDAAYSERVLNVSRVEDMIYSIDMINGQIENQRQYLSDSLLMQIDATNEAVTTAQFLITLDDNSTTGLDEALLSYYKRDISSGAYLDKLAEELGTKRGYIIELITVGSEVSSFSVIDAENASGSAGTLAIVVIGPNTDFTEKIMDSILNEVNSEYLILNESIAPHTISLLGEQSHYQVDNTTRDIQYNAANRFEVLQKQITTYNESLDELASKLGVSSKSDFFAYFSFNEDNVSDSTDGSPIKFAVIGFVLGAAAIALIVVLKYIFGRKFSTQSKFFTRFSRVHMIGIAKPTNRRSAFEKFIDKRTGDDNELSYENNNKLIAANVKNMTLGMDKVLFTGTAEIAKIKELATSLGVKVDVKDSFFVDPSTLESIAEYDGIILVEQRNYSDCKNVSKELELIASADTKLIGAIII